MTYKITRGLAVLALSGGLLGGAAACGGQPKPATPPPASSSAQAWTAAGVAAVQTIKQDTKAISSDAQSMNSTALVADCTQLTVDVQSARNVDIPNTEAQAHWAKALDYLQDGGTACEDGARNQDAARLSVAVADFQNATTELNAVTAALQG
jgi:hypothetical protein